MWLHKQLVPQKLECKTSLEFYQKLIDFMGAEFELLGGIHFAIPFHALSHEFQLGSIEKVCF